MARRTLAEYRLAVNHALGASPATGVDRDEIINDALQFLASCHEWNWRRGGPTRVSLNGPLSITGATWTESSKTLTATGAFTSYVFNAGDIIEITGGTGATAGDYVVASRTSANAIVLVTSIGAGADAQTDITATIRFPYAPLPSDYGEEISTTYPNSFARRMIRTTIEGIAELRAAPIQHFGHTFYYAITSGQSSSPAAGIDTPRIELYPTPTADVLNAITIVYRRNIARLTNAGDIPQIPTWMDYAFDLLCRSFAMTLEDDNPDNAAQQKFNSLLPDLKERDSVTQRRLGIMTGGLWPRTSGIDPLYPDRIGDPTNV